MADCCEGYEGYLAAMTVAGLPTPSEYTVGPEDTPAFAIQQDGYEGMLRLAQLRRPPTAVFARNDFAAIGAMHAARTLRLSIPGDVAIAGFDNIPLAAFTAPPLTTVEQPIARQGIEAAQFLLERMRGEAKKSRTSMMECHLVVRRSTDPQASNTVA